MNRLSTVKRPELIFKLAVLLILMFASSSSHFNFSLHVFSIIQHIVNHTLSVIFLSEFHNCMRYAGLKLFCDDVQNRVLLITISTFSANVCRICVENPEEDVELLR